MARARSPLLALAERQLVNLRQDKHIVAVVAARAISNLLIDVEVAVVVVVVRMLERIAAIERQAVSKALLHGGLQRVVFAVCIVACVVEALRPAILWVIGLPAVLGKRTVRTTCRIGNCERSG